MKDVTSLLELGQYLHLKAKSDINQSLISAFWLCFQWNRQRKSVAYGYPKGPCFSVTKTPDKAAFPLSFPPHNTSIIWQPIFGEHPGEGHKNTLSWLRSSSKHKLKTIWTECNIIFGLTLFNTPAWFEIL